MRTGGYTIQQTLTTEAASVLKHSLTLARRRGHAQVTPLHVAATLLSSRTSLLRRACVKSHPGFSTNYQFAPSRLHHHQNQNHPLQCRALELCFNVALNRLPTVPGPMFHGQPSLANALVAALKRAQAHQRRGCIEQQQQQQTQSQAQQTQLLAVKVELEQLVISILDDPSVSRVMKEAGFNSTAVKNCVEDCSAVFYGSSSVVGVFSSPNSPDQQHNRFHHYQNPKDFSFINPNFTLWQTHFLNHSPDQNPLLISSSSQHHHHRLDLKLGLQPLSLPPNLGFNTSGHEVRNMSNNVTATKSFSGYNKAEKEETVLSCCPECVTSFEREAKSLKANQDKLLPSWLQTHDGDISSHKEELIGLRRKWNRFCENLHQERINNQTGPLSLMGKNYPYGLPYGSSNESSRSISLIDSLGSKPNQRVPNSIAKFRRQNSCTIEFDLGGNEYEKGESINEAEDDNVTLDLGRSLFRSDFVTETRKKITALFKALEESIPWQSGTMRLIAESLMDCLSKKKYGWVMMEGSDTTAKRGFARTLSQSVFGSLESLVHIDLKKKGNESETLLACGLENRENVVFLIEDIDLADSRFLKLLADRFEGNQRIKTGIERQAIFIMTKEDSRNRDTVLKIGLEIAEQSLGRKRKPETDVAVKEGKNFRAGEVENGFWIKKEVFSRQSSFNSSYLDLNIKAEEDGEGEISPISSDLTGEEETEISSNDFLNRIQNRFVLNRSRGLGIEKAMITAAFREVFPEEGIRFSVEEKLVEEICGGYVQNGAFESWLKEVFQTGLLTVKKGGKKDTGVIRMVFGGIVDNKQYGGGVGGYMGTCLPNKVQVSKFE